MDPPEIADAARLAAGAPPAGVLSPRDAGLGLAWLDLRDRRAEVALQNASRVARALVPCLLVGDDARLFVSGGETPCRSLAQVIAHAFFSAGHTASRIAVVKGEDVGQRIEEFVQHGPAPTLAGIPPQPLGDRWRDISQAFAIPSPAILQRAIEEGAAVVISRAADDSTIQGTTLPEPNDQASGEVRLRFRECFRVVTLVAGEQEMVSRECGRYAGEHCRFEITPVGDHLAVTLESDDPDALTETCERLALVLVEALGPSKNLFTRSYEELTAHFDPSLMEFGLDIRPASEWIDQ